MSLDIFIGFITCGTREDGGSALFLMEFEEP
jgi:hypothetical protein